MASAANPTAKTGLGYLEVLSPQAPLARFSASAFRRECAPGYPLRQRYIQLNISLCADVVPQDVTMTEHECVLSRTDINLTLIFRRRSDFSCDRKLNRSVRIPDRFSQHGVKLLPGEFHRPLRRRLARRHNPLRRTCAGDKECGLSLRHRHDLRLCRRRPMAALQAHAQQFGAHRVTAMTQTSSDFRCAMTVGPKLFEQCYVFSIPTHGRTILQLPTTRQWRARSH